MGRKIFISQKENLRRNFRTNEKYEYTKYTRDAIYVPMYKIYPGRRFTLKIKNGTQFTATPIVSQLISSTWYSRPYWITRR